MLRDEILGIGDRIRVSGNLGCKREMARGGVTDESIKEMRGIVGPDPSDMDLIRALYLSRNDVASALNILFDTPSYVVKSSGRAKPTPTPKQISNSKPASTTPKQASGRSIRKQPLAPVNHTSKPTTQNPEVPLEKGCPSTTRPNEIPRARSTKHCYRTDEESSSNGIATDESSLGPSDVRDASSASQARNLSLATPDPPEDAAQETTVNKRLKTATFDVMNEANYGNAQEIIVPSITGISFDSCADELFRKFRISLGNEYCDELLFLGRAEVVCVSTCKGNKLKSGEEVTLSFPKSGSEVQGADSKRSWGRQKSVAATSDIVRFSSSKTGEIGRLPGEWARALVPLVMSRKVAVAAVCKAAPACLALLDGIFLYLGIFVSRSLFKKFDALSASSTVSSQMSVHNPLLSVLQLLRKDPLEKATFTPENLYSSQKRALELEGSKQGSAGVVPAAILSPEARIKLASGQPNDDDEVLSDSDLNGLVGTSDSSELKEMEPPGTLLSTLRAYQKQALYWMSGMEAGLHLGNTVRSLHPCWESYTLGDNESIFYVNVFSGEATLDFPSALQTSRGGILADAMGLGKTVMTIALLLSAPGKGGSQPASTVQTTNECGTVKNMRKLGSAKGGGTLIICPMTLLGQWKTELDAHVKPGAVSVLVHYGQDRMRDQKSLLRHDIVLTTYGVLTSEWNDQTSSGDGLRSIHWFRIVLDEAHTIKALRAQASQAASELNADCRWCLTGTPIQNKLEDVFSLLHFLRIEPWGSLGWWSKLIQKPFDEGDERGLQLLKAILQPLMLRRTKDTVDKEGRPILVLPTADLQVVQCEFSEAERDFYDALFKKSKVKFDMFVEQGKVLHNYASILELLLRLRQCCDHPFLVLSRGDTDEFSDLNKLARHFMSEGQRAGDCPSKAYIQEVMKDLRKGEKSECPICLEAVEDAVLTPCAHCICRECLYASWRRYEGGACPICRKHVNRQDLITAPKESRFHIDVEANWKASAKVAALLRELEILRGSGSKSIVFSQWTSFLDILQIPLKRGKFQFVRLDGSLSQQQREKVLKDFSTNPSILVMLISLKAGGVGINLTAASHAFLLDPWWNPAVEEQAIMRIHRIGQTKNVSIKRFICKDTVEEKMQLVQARKQRLIAGALTNQEVRSARIEELKMLFR